MSKIAVIGSGFSGLSAAAYLGAAGNEVHVFEKNETVFCISKDGETKIEAKIVEVHTEDPEFINYTIKVGERELNTLPNNLSPISYNNTPPSTSSSFDSNFVDLQLYQYSGKDGKFSYKGSADFEKVRKDVSDNLDSHECNFSRPRFSAKSAGVTWARVVCRTVASRTVSP